MNGWDVLTLILQFVIEHADVMVLLKEDERWHEVTAMRLCGAGLQFRVDGDEWDVSMHDLADIRLQHKQ